MTDTPAPNTQQDTAAPQALFVPNPAPKHSAATIIGFIVAALFVFGGIYMVGLAFSVPGAEFWLFGGGLVVDAIGLWIAFGLIPALEDRK